VSGAAGDRPALDPLAIGPYGTDWWREGVVYQVYPRSFADSDGDGCGDLTGIIDRLDHFGPNGIDVDALWLSPIYPSPGRDVGYDISDYDHVDPRFGTEADFARLVDEAHRRGLRIILDLVMNHTSDQHPWFEASRESREGPYADWYIWRDPAGFDRLGRPRRPNNWVSFFGGSAWTWEPRRRQFYLHTFLVEQPDVNWRNPAVEAAMFAMVEGWLDRGVDGFRLDVFNAFLKDPELRSNPRQPGPTAWTRQVHEYDRDAPDLQALLARFRALVDAKPGRFTVGELFDAGPDRAAALSSGHHLVFDWGLVSAKWSAEAFGALIENRERIFGPDRWPTLVLSNHDQPRQASRLAASAGIADVDGVARAAALLLFTLRGSPFMYYGEEIGMIDVAIPHEEIVDPPARRASPEFPWWNRDQCRTPMQWTGGPGAGFTVGRPWLRIGPDAVTRNVAAQAADPGSVLATYRRLLAVRRESEALRLGTYRRVEGVGEDVLAYHRRTDADEVLVLVNFSPEPRPVEWSGDDAVAGPWRSLVGTHRQPREPDGNSAISLRALEGVVLKRP
jgi:alpha-glucosidase